MVHARPAPVPILRRISSLVLLVMAGKTLASVL
jgi:hypothetical protein